LVSIIRGVIGRDGGTQSVWRARADVYEHSYNEVLAFLKHQDEKIGRVLTALAFLTAAGVALFALSTRPSHPLIFDKSNIDVGDFFFAVFTVSLLLSLLAILAAVDPTTQTPRFLSAGASGESIIFYSWIYKAVRNGTWLKADQDVEDLNERLARSFHRDAMELARRAEHKVSRFADSRAFVHIAIVALALLGLARIDGFDIHWRSWILASVLSGVGVLPIWDIALAMHYGFAGLASGSEPRPTDPWRLWAAVLFFLPALVAGSLLIYGEISSSGKPELVFVLYALATIFVSRFLLRYVKSPEKMVCLGVVVALIGAIPLLLFSYR
jgi:hypothetical protein